MTVSRSTLSLRNARLRVFIVHPPRLLASERCWRTASPSGADLVAACPHQRCARVLMQGGVGQGRLSVCSRTRFTGTRRTVRALRVGSRSAPPLRTSRARARAAGYGGGSASRKSRPSAISAGGSISGDATLGPYDLAASIGRARYASLASGSSLG